MYLIQADVLPNLPATHWAHPWIHMQQAVPFDLTHPYRVHIDRHAGVISVLDTSSGTGVVWLRREVEIDARILVTPFRILLNWMSGLFDASLLHAAAVRIGGRGLLLSGPSGSGKSTLALSIAADAGTSGKADGILGDDCVLLHDGQVWPVFARAKADARSMALIDNPAITAEPIPGGHFPKSFIDLRQFGDRFISNVQVDALLFPVRHPVSGAFTLDPRNAFDILHEESRRETGGGTERDRIRLARLCASVPATRVLVADLAEARAEVMRRALPDS